MQLQQILCIHCHVSNFLVLVLVLDYGLNTINLVNRPMKGLFICPYPIAFQYWSNLFLNMFKLVDAVTY